MRKLAYLITIVVAWVGFANAAVRDNNSISRATTKSTTSRNINTQTKKTINRQDTKNTVARSAKTTATTPRTPGVQPSARTTIARPTNSARATIAINTPQSHTFGTGYNTCREAYFTCMDQFCGVADDTYRRCICSSKLSEIRSREKALTAASDTLADFHNLNMTVIDKTAAQVKAMTSASTGEYAQSIAQDKSAAASQLANISDVLSNTKNKSLSTQGTLDIAGDINEIWQTSNLAGGSNIANLTGEALYNAVHAQCSQLTIDQCPNSTTQTMVASAYGMYIENDCSLLLNNLDKKLTQANSTIRASEQELNLARLENYKSHNSTSINDCIAQVRKDITADTACGTNYIHCLDITGRYLNIETGEPIYSPSFYQLESQVSLSGDILTNETNRLLVAELNRKRSYAARGLDTCRDLADEVWDEFMRQAITEIYQGQQERVRTVKNECLNAVTQCYDTQTQSLKDFSNTKDQLLLGSRLELSEEMCRNKLDTCSNLYGGGPTGMQDLVIAMHDIISQTIGQTCQTALQDYIQELCAVPSNDSLHSYPFACRIYAPGNQIYASIHACNTSTQNDITDSTLNCGSDYIGSLYQKLARYAAQTCVRPSESDQPLPATVLQSINTIMDQVRHDMSTALSAECERLGGIWVDTAWVDYSGYGNSSNGLHDITGDKLFKTFYSETSSNTQWGYCKTATTTNDNNSIFIIPQDPSIIKPDINIGDLEITPAG
ncbi:MAG: hypothetical protein R8N50_00400 [Alphaproteobacteria bacterium]|nr:hypothetical protein [Alphaproteobacteria bacterium]